MTRFQILKWLPYTHSKIKPDAQGPLLKRIFSELGQADDGVSAYKLHFPVVLGLDLIENKN